MTMIKQTPKQSSKDKKSNIDFNSNIKRNSRKPESLRSFKVDFLSDKKKNSKSLDKLMYYVKPTKRKNTNNNMNLTMNIQKRSNSSKIRKRIHIRTQNYKELKSSNISRDNKSEEITIQIPKKSKDNYNFVKKISDKKEVKKTPIKFIKPPKNKNKSSESYLKANSKKEFFSRNLNQDKKKIDSTEKLNKKGKSLSLYEFKNDTLDESIDFEKEKEKLCKEIDILKQKEREKREAVKKILKSFEEIQNIKDEDDNGKKILFFKEVEVKDNVTVSGFIQNSLNNKIDENNYKESNNLKRESLDCLENEIDQVRAKIKLSINSETKKAKYQVKENDFLYNIKEDEDEEEIINN